MTNEVKETPKEKPKEVKKSDGQLRPRKKKEGSKK